MFRVHALFAQAVTEYAGMLVQDALTRVRTSFQTLDDRELFAVGAGAVLLLVFLLRRGSTNLR